MKTSTLFLVTALLMALAVSVSAASTVIPKDTVIPVTLDTALSSATGTVGTTFYARHTGINGGGFPEHTRFTGNVDSVTRASGKTAGEIGVSFVGAKLPDGTQLPIVGHLTSLDDRGVTADSSGRLVGTTDARENPGKFIAIGAGAGLVLGQAVSKKPLIGAILGAAAGYLYGTKQAKPAVGKDVLVPAGTRFGVMLAEDVSVPDPWSAASPGSTGAGPVGPGWEVTFNNLQPVMSGNDLMVPFRSVMNSIQIPFGYDLATKTFRVNDYESQAVHAVGTKVIRVNDQDIRMDTASRIANGSLYVPASYIELLTNRTAYWNQRSGVLRLE